MEYDGLVEPRAVWRCVDAEFEFSYSRQLTVDERQKLEIPEEEPEPNFPGEGGSLSPPAERTSATPLWRPRDAVPTVPKRADLTVLC